MSLSQGNLWRRNVILDRMSLSLIVSFQDPDNKPLKFVRRKESSSCHFDRPVLISRIFDRLSKKLLASHMSDS